ncbi:hypothetical protein [Pelagibacterium mangrovi]|uniref:hypothetical protein n=1 Tax=Pelagibacterium mangrovi TaxID=3119828 RepID=UPI002FC5AB24
MFVAPRPLIEDDPWFAVRLALMPVIGFVLGMVLRSPMMMIYPTLMFSLTASNRKAFDPRRALGAPIAFSAMLWLMSGVVAVFYQIPLALLAVMALIYFLGFYLIQATGNAMGMLFIVAAALMSIMGLGSYQAMTFMRAEMTKAALCVAIVAPLLYLLLPPRTRELNVDIYTPAPEPGRVPRALIRAGVMVIYTLFLFTILDFSNVILAIGGMFVLVFSTRRSIWAEAAQRSFSVLLGGTLSLLVLGALSISAHLAVLAGLIFLPTLWLAHKMSVGRLPSMAYQDAAAIMIALVGSALTTSDPAFAFIQRASLTILGTLLAALAVRALDDLLVPALSPDVAKGILPQ